MSQKSEDDREKKGCSHFLSHSAEQNGFRWHRVKIDGEKTSVMWTSTNDETILVNVFLNGYDYDDF